MNLVIALLSTRQFLTAEKIRSMVAGYDESANLEAFYRMFERDKTELRELGIPLEIGASARYGGQEGYRINRDAYELPDIDLDRDEAAAVAVAARLWESPERVAAGQSALMKLRAGGVQVESELPVSVSAVPSQSRGSEPALGSLLAAIDAGRAVRFHHRTAVNVPPTRRDVEPWGVVTDRGRWYLVGFDRDRQAARTFRLSRIGDDVEVYGAPNTVRKPEGVNLRETIERFTASTPVTGSATVWVAEGRAQGVRRAGTVAEERRLGDRDGVVVHIPIRSRDWLVRLIAGNGADALVLAPAELRAAVVARLESVRDGHVTEAAADSAVVNR